MSYNLVDPVTGDLTQVAGGGFSIPVGTLIQQYKKKPMSGYLYCDGSTFDQNAYPALYMYLGTNVLPDYRECVMVGAEKNTTDTIATHDVYTEGEFKDDQLQDHTHVIYNTNPGGSNSESPIEFTVDNGSVGFEQKIVGYTRNARAGDTTHSKQKAVYVYIKATSGLAENQQDNVLNNVKDYVDSHTYSKYNTETNEVFIKNGNVGTYSFKIQTTSYSEAQTNVIYKDLQNLFAKNLDVQVSIISSSGIYPKYYLLNNSFSSTTVGIAYVSSANFSFSVSVTGVLKENYIEPF